MQIIGHRGARGLAPENTLAAIERGIEAGADWIEFDVRRTKDGHLIILHDRHTGRIAKRRVHVRRARYEQLRALPTRSGELIPQLLEVLELIGHRAKVNIEIKSPGCAEIVAQAIQRMVREGYSHDHFMVSSFYPAILADVHRQDARIPLALLELHLSLGLLLANRLGLKAIGLYHLTASKLAVRLAKKRGLFVYAHTVNNPKEAKRLATIGVDAIVTDYPDRMREAFAKRAR